MISLAEAQRRLLEELTPLPAEAVPVAEADGRVLRETIHSPLDLPPFDNSAMDGYAVRSADLRRASADTPVTLARLGRTAAGDAQIPLVERGGCVRVFTGSRLPEGADAVVMQEDTRLEASQEERVQFLEAVPSGENIRRQGEDVRAGELLVNAGERLNPARLALLAAVGLPELHVGRRPRLALLATGSELRPAGERLQPGQIYESNRAALACLATRAGALPTLLPLVPDEPGAVRTALAQTLTGFEVVVTAGGVSVGETDLVKRAFEETGGKIVFWQVAMRPGKPFVYGRRGDQFFFGLPGNPVSALVTFWLLVRPALLRLQGAIECGPPVSLGMLVEPLTNPGPRPHFARVCCSAGQVRSAGRQGSHLLRSLAASDGLVEVPGGTSLAAGTPVQVIRWD